MMPASEVTRLVRAIESAGMAVWIDGGWGVDALAGRQTRDHQDLDVAVLLSDVSRLRQLLTDLGYATHEDELPTRLEMRDARDHRVDLHLLTFDEEGNGLQQLQDGGVGTYTAEGLSARGRIDGMDVRCLSASLQMRFHEGYEPRAHDHHDVSLLAGEFGLPLPEAYR